MRKILSTLRHPLRAVFHAHVPTSIRNMGAEHVIMPLAYAVGAALVHHPIGSITIAGGYATIGVMAARSQRAAE